MSPGANRHPDEEAGVPPGLRFLQFLCKAISRPVVLFNDITYQNSDRGDEVAVGVEGVSACFRSSGGCDDQVPFLEASLAVSYVVAGISLQLDMLVPKHKLLSIPEIRITALSEVAMVQGRILNPHGFCLKLLRCMRGSNHLDQLYPLGSKVSFVKYVDQIHNLAIDALSERDADCAVNTDILDRPKHGKDTGEVVRNSDSHVMLKTLVIEATEADLQVNVISAKSAEKRAVQVESICYDRYFFRET
jgi:hypothetical protein